MDASAVGAVLLAIAGGVGGGLGGQLWESLTDLVHRPPRHHASLGDGAASGHAELAELVIAPADEERAIALAEALVTRAAADTAFRQALEAWWEQAAPVRKVRSDVTNSISGGQFDGPVFQGGDFNGLTIKFSSRSVRPSSDKDK